MAARKVTQARPTATVREMVVESIIEAGALAGPGTKEERATRQMLKELAGLALAKPSSGVNPRTKLHAVEMFLNRLIGPVIQTTANLNMNADVPHVPIDLRDPDKRRLAEQITRDVAGLLGQSGDSGDAGRSGDVETLPAPRASK
jgi:hypothetical protein